MTSSASDVQPPRIAALFVELFAAPHEADGILGDLAEEFSTTLAGAGELEARRQYRRHARRTIADLALSPLGMRRVGTPALARSAALLTFAVGVLGLFAVWPVAVGVNLLARSLVTRYTVYEYVPAVVFWNAVDLIVPLTTGMLIALGASVVRFRPLSAALATLAVMAVLLAVDQPMLTWLYGPPRVHEVRLMLWAQRWAIGMIGFGGTLAIGAVLGRLLPFQQEVRRHGGKRPEEKEIRFS